MSVLGRVSCTLVVAVTAALTVTAPAPASAETGPVVLTIYAPALVAAGSSFEVTGSATLLDAGVPSLAVEIRDGSRTMASVTTDTGGNYRASLTLAAGSYVLTATAFRGRPVESESDPATVTATSDTGGGPPAGEGPSVTITSHPPALTNSTSASFSFSTEPGATTRCSLDGGAFVSCTSPESYTSLTNGSHTFAVQATDSFGKAGATEAHSWVVDTVPPVVSISSAPPSSDNSTSATFTFSTEPDATLACSLDGGAFASCTSPKSYASLSEGSHTFAVHATDAAGNTGPSATHTWTVDTVAPDTSITSGPSGTVTTSSATFSFTATESPASFACSLNGGAYSPCVSPVSYSGLGDGSNTFAVRATDAAGNTDPTPATRSWTIDTEAPNVTITDTPPGLTNSTSASFSFTSESASFACSLDGAAFASCTSPKSYTDLVDGSHTFAVRATDTAGNTGEASSHSWTVDTTPPTVEISSGPPSLTSSTSASFAFSSEPGVAFACALDGAAFTSCASPRSYSSLAEGSHTFAVRATDAAGNTGPSAAHTWTVDSVPPQTSITAGPSGTVANATVSFSFTASEPATFACSLDGGAYGPCTSPVSYSALAEGSHTFAVRATDAAGNTDATPATRTWTVDTVAPTVTITSTPVSPTNSTSASFSFSASEAATFACSLDSGAFVSCTSPAAYGDLAHGSHTFEVRATDTAGNTGPVAAHGWIVDTEAPEVAITSAPSSPRNETSATFTFSSEPGAVLACSLDGGAFASCTSPRSYTSLAQGSHTFAVRPTDTAGNTGPSATHTWTVDTVAPDTSITSGPSGTVTTSSATFSFTATESPASFACSLNGGAYGACVSPVSYSGLGDGSHSFAVRATDAAGNTDPTPATRSWTIDTVAPNVTITDTPPGLTNSTSASFSFTSEAGVSFACSLDGAAFASCTSPKSYSDLVDGSHTFAVRATDTAGNTGEASSHSWTVDTTPPVAVLHTHPLSPTNQTSQTMQFSTEPGAVLECSLDGAAFTTCSSPLTVSGLADGSHTFAVRATDAAGNVDPTPDSATWVVDTVVDPATIGVTPTGPANHNTPYVAGAAEAGSLVRAYHSPTCNGSPVAEGSAADYASGLTIAVADDTSNAFSVRVTDAAGNVSACSAAVTYIEDSTPPSFPGSILAPGAAPDALMVHWPTATDTVSATLTYEVCLNATVGACASSFTVAATGTGSARLARASGLSSRARYEVLVRVSDEAGNRTLGTPAFGTTLGGGVASGITAASTHTCALISDGTARCWGDNSWGQLGDGTTTQQLTPVVVSGLSAAVAITAGRDHTCALISDGTARCWGSNGNGRLGDGTTTQRLTPVAVAGLSGAVAITAGTSHTCALTSDGTARCWGFNGSGQLGDGTTTQRLTPEAVSGLSGAVAITAGPSHTCALTSDGTARCWGFNGSGQLGDGTTTIRLTPVVVSGLSGAVAITAGTSHTCALISDGTARCWGNNGNGQLGDGTTTQRLTPVAVSGLSAAVAITAGTSHTCALISDGTARCWGNNANGRLGDGTTTQRLTPVAVSGLSAAVAITAGNSHTCALTSDGTVRCWGLNGNGQLGDGTTTQRLTPEAVSGLSAAVAITAGNAHTCALTSDGTARCWGWNSSGRLGDGTTTQRLTPVAVSGLSDAVAITAGTSHTCALISDGTVRCWGFNGSGQLGDGTTTQRLTPVAVSGLSDAVAITAGGNHTCALTSDGTARCWGWNSDGRLGDGTTTQRLTPVAVSGLSAAVAITAGTHTCALISDGTARCWGNNANGRLGDGTTTQRLTPVAVSGLSAAVAITAGTSHTCALTSDGTARCWGNNANGRLGDGTTTQRLTPVAVSGLAGAVAVTAGNSHTCALTSDGTARCWGLNGNGQLGDSTTTERLVPVNVYAYG